MALVMRSPETFDAFSERQSRLLWVVDADIVAYPSVRAAKLEARARKPAAARTGSKDWWGNEMMLLTYDRASYEEEVRCTEAKKTALVKKTELPPRPDVYVKGAMEWEKNAWKVWDKKKVQEEQRRDRYSTAMTSYLAGRALTHRFEPPAITQCAHCDIGGGIHPLRRCMGCMAVAYCCRMHQKAHWQWHKHICFAIRAANNLEAKRGEGAGWCKLRPRRWRRPPIENGCIVETNCRARWANWKQFYTNGAQSMLNQMGDGGPFVFKEWDEAIASMAMCEEATFVFSVGATQRAMMPFVACRKAPPGTVLVVEVGLINVKRDGGRRQEVNDFLTSKFVAEQRQKKLDRLDEQKFMRLRLQTERLEKADSVMKLLKANLLEKTGEELAAQKDGADLEAEKAFDAATGAPGAADAAEAPPSPVTARISGGGTKGAAGAAAAAGTAGSEAEEWEEEPTLDYEGFGEADDFFAQEDDLDAVPLNLPSVLLEEPSETSPEASPAAAAMTALTVPAGAAGTTPPAHALPFVAADAFEGARAGYVFKRGTRGVGYYRDVPSRYTPLPDDSSETVAVASSPGDWRPSAPSMDMGMGASGFGRAPWDPSGPQPGDGASGAGSTGVVTGVGSTAGLSPKSDDRWASVDAVDTHDVRVRDAAAAAKHAADVATAAKTAAAAVAHASNPAAAQPATALPSAARRATMQQLLEGLGLGTFADAFEAAGLDDVTHLAALHRSDAQGLMEQLTRLGLKMGQRQKVKIALEADQAGRP